MSVLLIAVFSACGSGGGGKEDDTQTTTSNTSSSLYCEHDGDLYVCAEGACKPTDDEDEVTAVEEVDEPADTADESESGVASNLNQVTPFAPKKKAMTINGAVTIVAECGSRVDFRVTEDNRSSGSVASE